MHTREDNFGTDFSQRMLRGTVRSRKKVIFFNGPATKRGGGLSLKLEKKNPPKNVATKLEGGKALVPLRKELGNPELTSQKRYHTNTCFIPGF